MEERISLLRSLMAPDDQTDLTDEQAAGLLNAAAEALLNRLYPFGWADEPVPPRYYTLQCRLAMELWARQGAEGELTHSENGVSRSWESSTLNPLLRSVPPFVGGVIPAIVFNPDLGPETPSMQR